MATLRIRQLRKAAGLSQAELASAAGITQSTVTRIRRGLPCLEIPDWGRNLRALCVEESRMISAV